MIPNKEVTINDKDAPWDTPDVKSALHRYVGAYTRWVKNGRDPITKNGITRHQVVINKVIETTKPHKLIIYVRKLQILLMVRRSFGQRINIF